MNNFIELFLEYLRSERNVAENTVASYELDLNHFFTNVNIDVKDVSHSDIMSYLILLDDGGFKSSSIRRKLSAFSHFFKFLQGEEIIDNNPMFLIARPRNERKLPKIIDSNMIANIENAIATLPEKERLRSELIFYLLYGSGLRVSELISIKLAAFVDGKNFIKIYGKGNKERIVPIASRLQHLVEDLKICCRMDSVWVFPSLRAPQKHITRQRVFQIIKDIAASAGIDKDKISPHVFRHAFATHILNNGADLLSVKKILGHKDIATTEIYTHVDYKKLQETVVKHHVLSKKQKI